MEDNHHDHHDHSHGHDHAEGHDHHDCKKEKLSLPTKSAGDHHEHSHHHLHSAGDFSQRDLPRKRKFTSRAVSIEIYLYSFLLELSTIICN